MKRFHHAHDGRENRRVIGVNIPAVQNVNNLRSRLLDHRPHFIHDLNLRQRFQLHRGQSELHRPMHPVGFRYRFDLTRFGFDHRPAPLRFVSLRGDQPGHGVAGGGVLENGAAAAQRFVVWMRGDDEDIHSVGHHLEE